MDKGNDQHMPNLRFTQEVIDSLKPPSKGRAYFWDTTTPGFGIRISTLGRKTWVTQYRVNGKSVTETIGSVTDLPAVKDAREYAQRSRMTARAGIDPTAAKRIQKQTQKVEKKVAEQTKVEEQKKALTFGEAAHSYVRDHCRRKLRPSTLIQVHRALEHDILPYLGDIPLVEITRKHVKELVERKAAIRERPRKGSNAGAGIQANRNLTRIIAMLNWCVRQELLTSNPALGIDKPAEEQERERVLRDNEISALWHATGRTNYPWQQIVRLLLLTGQRRSEVAGMRWSELELEKELWTIPRERTKSNRTHLVHLSPLAMQIIESVPQGKNDLLFPGRSGRKHVMGFVIMKPALDTKMSTILRHKLEPWVLHDLRRTCASKMAQLRVPPHVLDRVLNHSSGTIKGVAAIYNRYEYLDERRDALNLWATHVEQLVNAKVKRVVL